MSFIKNTISLICIYIFIKTITCNGFSYCGNTHEKSVCFEWNNSKPQTINLTLDCPDNWTITLDGAFYVRPGYAGDDQCRDNAPQCCGGHVNGWVTYNDNCLVDAAKYYAHFYQNIKESCTGNSSCVIWGVPEVMDEFCDNTDGVSCYGRCDTNATVRGYDVSCWSRKFTVFYHCVYQQSTVTSTPSTTLTNEITTTTVQPSTATGVQLTNANFAVICIISYTIGLFAGVLLIIILFKQRQSNLTHKSSTASTSQLIHREGRSSIELDQYKHEIATGSVFPSTDITYEENNYYDSSEMTWQTRNNLDQSDNEKMKNKNLKLTTVALGSEVIVFEENNYYVSGDFKKTEVKDKVNDVTSGNNGIVGTSPDIELVENEYYAGCGFIGNKFGISEPGLSLPAINPNPDDIVLEENTYYVSTPVHLNSGQSSLSTAHRNTSNKDQINPEMQIPLDNSGREPRPNSVVYLDLSDTNGQTIPASERDDGADESRDAIDANNYYNNGAISAPTSKDSRQVGNMYDPVILSGDSSDEEYADVPAQTYDYTYVKY